MMSIALRNYLVSVGVIVVAAVIVIGILDSLFAGLTGFLSAVYAVSRVTVMILSGLCVTLLTRRLRSSTHSPATTRLVSILSFFMIIIVSVIVFFGILNSLHVPPESLLLGGATASIVVGLVISTLFGNILSGALVLTTFPYKVGDNVLVNNTTAGVIAEITTLYTAIRTASGNDFIVPNSAITGGGVAVAVIPSDPRHISQQLNVDVGDRIYTSYIGGEGVVTEITPFHIRVRLDSNREVTVLTQSVLNGSVQIARILQVEDDTLSLSVKIAWDPEIAIQAMKAAGRANPTLFKAPVDVSYSSLDGNTVELSVSTKVDPSAVAAARSTLLKAAYDASRDSSSSSSSSSSS